MSLDIIETLRGGLRDTLSSKGLKFMGLAYMISIISKVSSQSILSKLELQSGLMNPGPMMSSLAVDGPLPLWTGLGLIGSLAGLWLTIGVLRNFVGENSESIDTDLFTENLGLPFLNLIIGGLVFGLIVGVGFMLLVIPGIFLLVSLLFWTVYVSVEDENFIDAMKKSWNMAKGNRFDILLIGAGTLVIGLAAGIVAGIPGALVGTISNPLGALVGMTANAFSTVFTLAILARAYRQLR
ncbi:MAG: hypothetical protein BRC29_01315 [Nanohaloarchaea archaeon SW_7_43_1]|nr:MAG: hypothetical protein BRC29_01315 [Nanohaloarchaea archaeon SW_7_43_1]